MSFTSGDDPRFNSRRTEDAKSEIDVPGTAENEDFLPAEPESILSVYPQFLVIDAVVPAPAPQGSVPHGACSHRSIAHHGALAENP